MSDSYILQKELLLPGIRNGKIIMPIGTHVVRRDGRYDMSIPPFNGESVYCFSIDSVENNPDWFIKKQI